MLKYKSWAERTFGSAQFHDIRRREERYKRPPTWLDNPLGSLPAHLQTWKETKALYRVRGRTRCHHAALLQPHLQQTRDQAKPSPVVLLVQDTSDIGLSRRRKISGVGQIGNEEGRGFFVQTVLAVHPQTREVLGCIGSGTFCAHSRSRGRTAVSTAQTRRA